ncbi:nuclear transport factor 2 family protein [Flavobacterium sp.]|uniref:nuclear transport factor 2 family protein n=1 Tax=Flavobacterium sp. TaxID=239 RepID=UPI004048A803
MEKLNFVKKRFLLIMLIIISTTAFSQTTDVEAVKSVLKKYNEATQKMDLSNTKQLFATNSQIFESGGSEGSYEHYFDHHLAPEFKEFKSFTITDYKVETVVESTLAYAIETYNYTIVIAKDNKEFKRKCVVTSVLKKENDEWKIVISHNSSRK